MRRNTLTIHYVRTLRRIGLVLLDIAFILSIHERRILAAEARRIAKELVP